MKIEKETKERFVRMLKDRQIIVIQCNRSNSRKTYDYKIIGANNDGKWDFTPLAAQLSGYPNNSRQFVERLCIHSLDGVAVVCDILRELNKEGLYPEYKNGDRVYFKVRDLLTFFYL